MKKLITTLSLALLLVGCGSSNTTEQTTTIAQSTPETVVETTPETTPVAQKQAANSHKSVCNTKYSINYDNSEGIELAVELNYNNQYEMESVVISLKDTLNSFSYTDEEIQNNINEALDTLKMDYTEEKAITKYNNYVISTSSDSESVSVEWEMPTDVAIEMLELGVFDCYFSDKEESKKSAVYFMESLLEWSDFDGCEIVY